MRRVNRSPILSDEPRREDVPPLSRDVALDFVIEMVSGMQNEMQEAGISMGDFCKASNDACMG